MMKNVREIILEELGKGERVDEKNDPAFETTQQFQKPQWRRYQNPNQQQSTPDKQERQQQISQENNVSTLPKSAIPAIVDIQTKMNYIYVILGTLKRTVSFAPNEITTHLVQLQNTFQDFQNVLERKYLSQIIKMNIPINFANNFIHNRDILPQVQQVGKNVLKNAQKHARQT